MTAPGPRPKLTAPGAAEMGMKDLQRMLTKAEQKIRNLQNKMADQQREIREWRAQARREENLVAEQAELKAEIAELRMENKELTRANREHVERYDALQAERERLKVQARTRVSTSTGDTQERTLRSSMI